MPGGRLSISLRWSSRNQTIAGVALDRYRERLPCVKMVCFINGDRSPCIGYPDRPVPWNRVSYARRADHIIWPAQLL